MHALLMLVICTDNMFELTCMILALLRCALTDDKANCRVPVGKGTSAMTVIGCEMACTSHMWRGVRKTTVVWNKTYLNLHVATTQGPQRLDAVSCRRSLSFGIIPTVSLKTYRWQVERVIDSLICARAVLCLAVALTSSSELPHKIRWMRRCSPLCLGLSAFSA